MVKIGLQIRAALVNVDKIHPHDPRQFCWPVKVRCTGCGEENSNWHLISEDEEVELSNTKVNFCYKCKCCNRENHLTLLTEVKPTKKGKKDADTLCKEYTSEDNGEFRTVMVFDCRGLELTAFEPRDGWAAVSGRKLFPDVDLSDKDGWTEYNDIDNIPVEINNVEHQFVTIKG